MDKAKFRHWIFPILFMLFAAWTAIGAFPLVNYEGDSNNVEGGSAYLAATGEISREWSYSYHDQPLVYWTLAGISRVTGFGVDAIYCMLSWLSMLWLGWLSVITLRRITGIPRCILLMAWWLLPESFACGMYANSTVVAMPIFMSGIWLILRKKYLYATLLLCLAPLFRIDVVCVYPVVFPLMCFTGTHWRKCLGISVIMAVAVVIAAIAGVQLLGGDIFVNLHEYGRWNEIIKPHLIAKAIIGCYNLPGMLLVIFGVIMLIRNRKYLLLSILILPMICDHLVFFRMGCAAKHFLYALPFAAGLCAYTLQCIIKSIRERKTIAIAIMALLCIYETCYVVMLRSFSNIYEEMLPDEKKRIPRLNLFKLHFRDSKIYAGIGGGAWFSTEDEIMLTSGYAVYPFAIHNLKRQLAERMNSIFTYLDGTGEDYIAYSFTYDSRCTLIMHLFENGWIISPGHINPEKFSDVLNPDDNYAILEMQDSDGRRVSVRDYGSIPPPKIMIDQKVPVKKNFIRNFILKLKSDGRPVYIICPGYLSFAYQHYIDPLEEEQLLIRKAQGVWLVNTEDTNPNLPSTKSQTH